MANRSFKIVSSFHEEEVVVQDLKDLDVIDLDNGNYHILKDGHKSEAKIVSSDENTKVYTVEINGNTYDIQLKDHYDQLIDKMGLASGGEKKTGNIIAPMPGLILDVMVAEGDELEKGDPLFILEAMKMENVIKSSGVAKVKKVHLDKGESVDKGQLIIEMI